MSVSSSESVVLPPLRFKAFEGKKFPTCGILQASGENPIHLGGKSQEEKKTILLFLPLPYASVKPDSSCARTAKGLMETFSQTSGKFRAAGFQFYALSARGQHFADMFLTASGMREFPLLCDEHFDVAGEIALPIVTNSFGDADYYPMVMLIFGGVINKIFFPLSEEPEKAAEEVLNYLSPWMNRS